MLAALKAVASAALSLAAAAAVLVVLLVVACRVAATAATVFPPPVLPPVSAVSVPRQRGMGSTRPGGLEKIPAGGPAEAAEAAEARKEARWEGGDEAPDARKFLAMPPVRRADCTRGVPLPEFCFTWLVDWRDPPRSTSREKWPREERTRGDARGVARAGEPLGGAGGLSFCSARGGGGGGGGACGASGAGGGAVRARRKAAGAGVNWMSGEAGVVASAAARGVAQFFFMLSGAPGEKGQLPPGLTLLARSTRGRALLAAEAAAGGEEGPAAEAEPTSRSLRSMSMGAGAGLGSTSVAGGSSASAGCD